MKINCLHCAVAKLLEFYIEANNENDSTVLFVALAEVIGDLLANSEEMYNDRDNIMKNITNCAYERARSFLDDDDRKTAGRMH